MLGVRYDAHHELKLLGAGICLSGLVWDLEHAFGN